MYENEIELVNSVMDNNGVWSHKRSAWYTLREALESSFTEAGEMPEVKRIEFKIPVGTLIFCDPDEVRTLESFCSQQNKKIEEQGGVIESVYSTLGLYGIPRTRARRPDNGIMVLMSRMQKEISGYQSQIEALEEEKKKAIDHIENLLYVEKNELSWDHPYSKGAVKEAESFLLSLKAEDKGDKQ